jgi:pimeloyl-ACP methyl ester carboxylesterase
MSSNTIESEEARAASPSKGAWWQSLPYNFTHLRQATDFSAVETLGIKASAASDIVLRTIGATLIRSTALRSTLTEQNFRDEKSEFAFYQRAASGADPDVLFRTPPSSDEVESSPIDTVRLSRKKGQVSLLTFDSPFETANPNMNSSYQKHENNRRAYAHHWTHGDSPRPTICVIHGYLASKPAVNASLFELPRFFQQGYDILFYTLPFHGQRSGQRAPFSGHGLFANGFSSLCEAMAHAVFDFRIFLDELERRGTPSFGVTGISLGGYTSALLAAIDTRLAFSIPNVPVASMFDLFMLWYPINSAFRSAMARSEVLEADIRHQLASHSPLTYAPVIDRDRLLVIAGAGDRAAPPQHAQAIAEHWGNCNLEWFPGGHVIHAGKRRYLNAIDRHFEKIGFVADERPGNMYPRAARPAITS